MAGLGLAILGGALEETGKGIADRGKALREAKLKALDQEAEFNFRREMADKEIGARTEATKQDQTFTAGENAKSRQTQMDIANIRTENNSANVADANWLVKNGIAPDLKSAYEKVTSAAGDKTARSRMIIDVAKTMAGNSEPIPGVDEPTFADYQAAATTQVDALIQSSGGGGADSTAPAPSKRSTYEDAGKPAGGLPAVKDRKVGQKYTNPNGATATWTENGWVQ